MEKKCYVCGAPMRREGQMCPDCLERTRKMMEKAIFPKNEYKGQKKAADSEELERILSLNSKDKFDEDYDDEEFEEEDYDEPENEEEIVLNIRIPYGCRKITINIEEE